MALLDLVSWHLNSEPARDIDPQVVTLLLGRREGSEDLEALCSLRAVLRGLRVNIYVETLESAPSHPRFRELPVSTPDFSGSSTAKRWAGYLKDWDQYAPLGAAIDLVGAHPTLRLYPNLSVSPRRAATWSLRADGLEVGSVTADGGTLTIGKDGKSGGQSLARSQWRATSPSEDHYDFGVGRRHSVDDAKNLLRRLIQRFPATEFGLDHGQPEHALESRVLREEVPMIVEGVRLRPVQPDALVARSSQFPTQWAREGRAKYLDALLGHDDTPWAVEIKIHSTGGAGQYYRHGIGQAVLYRHFIRTAPEGTREWFEGHRLDIAKCRAALAVPRSAPRATQVSKLRQLADRFDVIVSEL